MKSLTRMSRILRYGFPQRRPQLPLLVIFHITTRCNMACRHCGDDVWGDPKNDLSLEEIAKFSADLGTIESLALGGGEPFLRPDLTQICRLFARNNHVSTISIPSNGFAPDSICLAVQSILEACPKLGLNIMLSLDGFQETHDAIRTAGSYSRVLETARRLKTLSTSFPLLSLSFNSTINNRNWQELTSLSKYVSSEFQARLEFNIISGNPRDSALTPPPRKELEQTINGLLNSAGTSPLRGLYNELYQEVLLKANDKNRQVIPCRAGSLVSLIDANGDVRACPFLPALGNLRYETFHNIWHGHQASKQFRSIIGGGCACNNDCFIRISLMNYWKLPMLLMQRLTRLRRSIPGDSR